MVREKESSKSEAEKAMTLLITTWDRRATDPRDKVYSIMGLVDLGLKLDYTITQKKLYEAVGTILIGGRKPLQNVLEAAGRARQAKGTSLPSWTTDWHTLSQFDEPNMLCLPLLDCNSGSLLSHLAPSIVEEIIITQGVNFNEINVVFSFGKISSRMASSRPECSKAEKSLDYAQALLEFLFQADLDTIALLRIAGQERYITGFPLVFAVLRTWYTDRDVY
jgi:hypothetical protein